MNKSSWLTNKKWFFYFSIKFGWSVLIQWTIAYWVRNLQKVNSFFRSNVIAFKKISHVLLFFRVLRFQHSCPAAKCLETNIRNIKKTFGIDVFSLRCLYELFLKFFYDKLFHKDVRFFTKILSFKRLLLNCTTCKKMLHIKRHSFEISIKRAPCLIRCISILVSTSIPVVLQYTFIIGLQIHPSSNHTPPWKIDLLKTPYQWTQNALIK